jgi:hypothetical protein
MKEVRMDLSQAFASLEGLIRSAGNTAEDIRNVFNSFFQNIAKNPALQQERPEEVTVAEINEELEDFANQPEVFGAPVDMTGTQFKRIGKYRFVYGGFRMRGQDGLLIYSERLRLGVIALVWDDEGAMRYRLFAIPDVLALNAGTRHTGNVRRYSGEMS